MRPNLPPSDLEISAHEFDWLSIYALASCHTVLNALFRIRRKQRPLQSKCLAWAFAMAVSKGPSASRWRLVLNHLHLSLSLARAILCLAWFLGDRRCIPSIGSSSQPQVTSLLANQAVLVFS